MNWRIGYFGFITLTTLVLAPAEFDARALWPSVVAIATVLVLRSALGGLLIGAAAGALLVSGGKIHHAFAAFFTEHLIPSLQSQWNLSVLIFTLLLGGFAALLERGRGLEAILTRWLARTKNSKVRAELAAYGLGLTCFFDGLASSLLTGKTIRPMSDRVGVSRAKLSYIVDSTSSAVACVAIMSTWIAYQLSMIREGYKSAGMEEINSFQIFLHSIPFNFYCWFTLCLLLVAILRSWHPGPMGEAEKQDLKANEKEAAVERQLAPAALAWNALIPLLTLIGGLMLGLYLAGIEGAVLPITFDKVMHAFGAAPADQILLRVSVIACLVAWFMNRRTIAERNPVGATFMDGVQRMFAPCLILVAAWCLSSTLGKLNAAPVLAHMLDGKLAPAFFPAAVFGVGILTSFTTGTSWGTMGVLMPLVLPVAISMEASLGADSLVPATVAAVFSGAVFGDHCSPLSDTTIVSSVACDIDPVEHVRTQLPYALTAAGFAVVLGFIPAGMGTPPLLCLIFGFACLALLPNLVRDRSNSHA